MRFNRFSYITICKTFSKSYLLVYYFEDGGILLHRTIDDPIKKYFYCWTANTK